MSASEFKEKARQDFRNVINNAPRRETGYNLFVNSVSDKDASLDCYTGNKNYCGSFSIHNEGGFAPEIRRGLTIEI